MALEGDYLNENLCIMKLDLMLCPFLHVFSAFIESKIFAIFYAFSVFFFSFFSFSVFCSDLKNTPFITMFYIFFIFFFRFYYQDLKETSTKTQFGLSSHSIAEPLQ